jgi:hypothetical protein
MEKINPIDAKFITLNDELEKIDFQERPIVNSRKEREMLDKMISKRTKLLETKHDIDEDMKLRPDNYTEQEKEYMEKMKPLNAVLDIKNLEDELALLEDENKGERTKENLNKMQSRITDLLTNANDIYLSTPDSNPYKKNLKEVMERLKAKQSLLTLEDQKLDMLAREEQAKEE